MGPTGEGYCITPTEGGVIETVINTHGVGTSFMNKLFLGI